MARSRQAELLQWRQRVEAVGIPLRYQIRHEIIESIYFNDPNGYPIEITWQVRAFNDADKEDAAFTIDSAIELERARATGKHLRRSSPSGSARRNGSTRAGAGWPRGVAVYVLNVPEFAPLIDVARKTEGYQAVELGNGYVRD
ncbi:hypothetical protein ACTMU2_13515 [Cupriavidus basilensis]